MIDPGRKTFFIIGWNVVFKLRQCAPIMGRRLQCWVHEELKGGQMARLNFEEIGKDLEKKGVDSDTINTVKQTIADKMEPQTIDKAVLFLVGQQLF